MSAQPRGDSGATIVLIGRTATGVSVNVYRAAYKNVPIVEIFGHGGRMAFTGAEMPQILELLRQAQDYADDLDMWLAQEPTGK